MQNQQEIGSIGNDVMKTLIHGHDWSRTALGPMEAWPQSLKTAVGIMLTTRHPVFIFWGPELICLYNDAYAASLGPEKHPAILGMPAREAWPEAYPLVADELDQVMSGGAATWRENHLVPIIRHGHLEHVYWTYSYGPIHDAAAPNGVGGVLALITETTQTVMSLRESEAKYRTLFESIDEGFCILELIFDDDRPVDYRFVEINPAFERQTGIKAALGRTIRELVPNIEPFWIDAYGKVAITGKATRFADHAPSMERWFDVYAFRIGEPAERRVAVLFNDITERKRAELALRHSEERFRAIAEQAEIGIAMVDIEGRVTFVNDRWCDLVGRTRAQVSGQNIRELTHPDDWIVNEPPFRRMMAEGVPFTIEKRYVRPNGSPIWVRNAVSALRDGKGRIIGGFAMSLDMSDRKAAEEALRESEARFRTMADNAPVMIWLSDAAGRDTYVSRRWLDFTGQSEEEAFGTGWLNVIHPDDQEMVHRMWLAACNEAKPFRLEFRLRRADGAYRWVIGDGAPRFGSEGKLLGYIGSVTDIDERRDAEQRQLLLAREVDHRARNALAVVQAVVRLTRTDKPEDFRTAVEGRVAALARAHGLLAKSRWAGADLRTLVSEELAPYLDPRGERASITGPSVVLAPDAVQPMGMVLHELATNAAKYGALSVPEGRVDVTWTLEEKGLRLDWREKGGPSLAGKPARQGFGTGMIHRAAEQLGGVADLEWQRTGLHVVLTLGVGRLAPESRPQRSAPDSRPSASGNSGRLEGRHVLLVEDDALLAMALQQVLEELGCTVVGPAGTLGEALRLSADAPRLDAAVLDVNLRGQDVRPAAEFLAARGVPRLFTTGYGDVVDGGDAPVLQKPVVVERLAATLAGLLGAELDG